MKRKVVFDSQIESESEKVLKRVEELIDLNDPVARSRALEEIKDTIYWFKHRYLDRIKSFVDELRLEEVHDDDFIF